MGWRRLNTCQMMRMENATIFERPIIPDPPLRAYEDDGSVQILIIALCMLVLLFALLGLLLIRKRKTINYNKVIKIGFYLLHKIAHEPKRALLIATGFDLYACSDVYLPLGEIMIIDKGVGIQVKPQCWFQKSN